MAPSRLRSTIRRILGTSGSTNVGTSGGHDGHSEDAANTPSAPGLQVVPHPARINPVLACTDVTDVSVVSFVADPFVVCDETRFHCFFEIKSRDRRRWLIRETQAEFDIGHATSFDGLGWTYQGVVLPASQSEHTYPFVFRHDGDWFMTPSPAGATPDEFRVYRSTSFPEQWDLVDRALTEQVRIDPTPFEFEGMWYLLYQATDTYDVVLRTADSLVGGDWVEHPASPLFSPGSNAIAPGGRPLVYDEHVDVFFRRGDPGVVEAWRLRELTPDSLELIELPTSPVISASATEQWNSRNMHHIDAGVAVESGADIVLVDGQDENNDYRLGVYKQR